MAIHSVTASEAYHYCDPNLFSFQTTTEVDHLTRFIGQDRALEAVDFGIGIQQQGFNLFVIGPEGSGRHSVIQSFINKKAATEPPPSDWCYVQNFPHPHKPLALEFTPGQGIIFKQEMHELIDMLKTTLPTIFEGEAYRARSSSLIDKLQLQIEKLYHEVEKRAKDESIAVIKTEQGILFVPMDGKGKKMASKEFNELPEKIRKEVSRLIDKYQGELQEAIHQISILKRKSEEQSRKLKKKTAKTAVSYPIKTLKTKYDKQTKIIDYLNNVEEEIAEQVDDFLYSEGSKQEGILSIMSRTPSFDQYEVNLLISHENHGAPVVYEDLPTYSNLHGRIEHKAAMGVLTTHFSLIKAGALHRANGGYIILDARRLLTQPFAYEGLKRTLRSRQIRIEPVERLLGLMSTVSLEPEPVPLQTKVVLIGDPWTYYLLNYYDPEFASLFKVQADFENSMDRNEESQQLYSSLLATIAGEKDLLPLHKTAVSRVIEQATRQSGDRDKLSLHIRSFADLIQEADYLAQKKQKTAIDSVEIEEALEAARRRGNRIRDRIFEAIDKGTLHIETSGKKTGQINGLSVIQVGSPFGCPARITALTRPGKGNIIDIEREVELGGAFHSKGVMILDAFLSSRYARSIPLSLRASLVFEQSYSDIDGDSASCAELCVLLSSLADAPIHQAIAITGAISQQGEVQAIGGVNEKIEGFYDICQKRGLKSKQGVIIPAANVRHLMLKKEVVTAIKNSTFFIHAVDSVDDAIELLTTIAAGVRDKDGNYPQDSINGRVEATLLRFARDIQEFDKSEEKNGQKSD